MRERRAATSRWPALLCLLWCCAAFAGDVQAVGDESLELSLLQVSASTSRRHFHSHAPGPATRSARSLHEAVAVVASRQAGRRAETPVGAESSHHGGNDATTDLSQVAELQLAATTTEPGFDVKHPYVTSKTAQAEDSDDSMQNILLAWCVFFLLVAMLLLCLCLSEHGSAASLLCCCRCRCRLDRCDPEAAFYWLIEPRNLCNPRFWCCCFWWRGADHHDLCSVPSESLGEDTYGFALASLIRDSHYIVQRDLHKAHVGHRYMRLAVSQLVLVLNMSIQIFLLYEIWTFVASKKVHDIREAYDEYEFRMYGSLENHTYLNHNLKHRGLPVYFNPELFKTLPPKLQEDICNMPFSQPTFYLVVILIWSLCCMAEIRKTCELFMALVVNTPTIPSMTLALSKNIESVEENERILDGLTKVVKVIVVYTVLLPRLLLTCFLMWLGCRVLAATVQWSDLVLNAIALEFILQLKDMIYTALVSSRSKLDLVHMTIKPTKPTEPAGYGAFLGTLCWGILACIWCLLYLFHFQQVLPDFRWDVHKVCLQYINWAYNIKPYESDQK